MKHMKITLINKTDIPKEWEVLKAKSKAQVTMRECNGIEKFKVSWADALLESNPDVDVILDNGKEYPCKKDIFEETYEKVEGIEFYRKKTLSTLVKIPEGVEVEIVTLEGNLPVVTYPDYVVIGIKGELYANTKEFVDTKLEII